MNLTHLKYFRTVAETGKIASAAEALFISAPALSTALARLEKELGMPLFERSGNRVTLNKQGQIFLRYVEQVFAALDCAQTEMCHSLLQQEEPVGVATMLANPWVDLLGDFCQTHREIPLTSSVLRPAQIAHGGLPTQYTFLLAETEELPAAIQRELDSVSLFRDQPAVLLHPSHQLADRDSVTMAQLEGENLFLPVEHTAFSGMFLRLFREHGKPVPPGSSSPYIVYHHMVEQGLGVAFTTVRAGKMAGGSVVCVPIRDFGACWDMRIFWRRDKALGENERCFLNFTKKFYDRI